jgi:hypothetical protein
VPAGAVTSVGDGEVHVALSRAQIDELPLVPHPEAAVDDERSRQMTAAFERAAHEWPMQD